MYAEERQQAIVELALTADRVAVADLAERFEVTTETIRRDLEALDRRGILRRVHGGAVMPERLSLVEPALADREPSFAAQKQRIAQAALAYLPPAAGSSVILDAGTTVGRVAALLQPGGVSTVITNSVPAAGLLAAVDGIAVHLLGGRVRGLTQACVGPEAVARLATLRCDVAFIGANGVTARHGLSTPDHDEAAVKRAMVRAAARVVVLVDSSKIGSELLVSFAPLEDVDVLVTDSGIPTAHRASFEAAGIEVVVA
jgi:DeoR family fructose operon transcriptional repressor